jgi:hypothetical protein
MPRKTPVLTLEPSVYLEIERLASLLGVKPGDLIAIAVAEYLPKSK